MTHQLVVTTTRAVLENATSAHVRVAASTGGGGSFRNRGVLTDVRKPKCRPLTRSGASCSRAAGPGVHICRDTAAGVNYDASACCDNDSRGARKRNVSACPCCGQHGRRRELQKPRRFDGCSETEVSPSDQIRRVMQSWCWPGRAHLQGHGSWSQL